MTGQELPPPSISGASQLTALRFSLHTLSPVALREQWPALLATLQGLPALKVQGGAVRGAWGLKGWPCCMLGPACSATKGCSGHTLSPFCPSRSCLPLQDIGVHCSREQNREAQEVVALLRELLGGSVLRCIFQGWIGSDEPIFW